MVNKSERKRMREGQRERELGRKIFDGWFAKPEEEFQTDSRLDSYLHEKEREIYSSY